MNDNRIQDGEALEEPRGQELIGSWIECEDNRGQPYYYNVHTKETTRCRPLEVASGDALEEPREEQNQEEEEHYAWQVGDW